MSDIGSVVIGGVLALAGSFGAKLWEGYRDAKALRGAFRAEIGSLLEIALARQHVQKAEHMINQWKAGQDIPYPLFGSDYSKDEPVFENNAGRIGIIGEKLAAEVTSFYTRLRAVRISVRAFEQGNLNQQPLPVRIFQAEEALTIWKQACEIADRLVKEL